jgi:hypothetical protein
VTRFTEREHTLEALGRVVKSAYRQLEFRHAPAWEELEHTYAGAAFSQNMDGNGR